MTNALRSRVFENWKGLVLTEEFVSNPEKSESQVTLDFSSPLMQLQSKFDSPYHDYRYLRDQKLSALDKPSVQAIFRDCMPRSSKIAIYRIMNRLSDKNISAGNSVAHFTDSYVAERNEGHSSDNHGSGEAI